MIKVKSEMLNEARRYLPEASEIELKNFAARQLRSRERLAELLRFYGENNCRMARLHLLASCAVTLGRFAGFSRTFDEMGEHFMPTKAESEEPRTTEWRAFAEACQAKMPLEVREERWLAAHFADLQAVRENGLYNLFEIESARHARDATWQLLQQHMDVSLGVRLMDKHAIAGMLPYETAIADSLALTTKKLFTAGLRLLWRYAVEAARAVFDFSDRPAKNVLSYRRTAFGLVKYTLASLTAAKLFRQGLRQRERGRIAADTGWNLLEETLGGRVAEIHPTIIDFYANPSKYDVTATLKLETLPARFWSWALTLLFGQGLYETDLKEIPARFRVFSRRDDSMHFVRELYWGDKLRVFDSDFVVRGGKLYEVFTDLKMAIQMHVEPIENGGLKISGKRIFAYGWEIPIIALHVEFRSQVETEDDEELLKINGILEMRPRTKFGRFFAYKILRRPKNLGSIHYRVKRRDQTLGNEEGGQ